MLKLLVYQLLVLTFKIKCAPLFLFLLKETRVTSHLFTINDGEPKDNVINIGVVLKTLVNENEDLAINQNFKMEKKKFLKYAN